MGWSYGYDTNWHRDIGYGVPATCDQPGCMEEINRGLAYVCGGEPYGGEDGCGLHFCDSHLRYVIGEDKPQRCERCTEDKEPYEPTPDVAEWLEWKLTHGSWAIWRDENPDAVKAIAERLAELAATTS